MHSENFVRGTTSIRRNRWTEISLEKYQPIISNCELLRPYCVIFGTVSKSLSWVYAIVQFCYLKSMAASSFFLKFLRNKMMNHLDLSLGAFACFCWHIYISELLSFSPWIGHEKLSNFSPTFLPDTLTGWSKSRFRFREKLNQWHNG